MKGRNFGKMVLMVVVLGIFPFFAFSQINPGGIGKGDKVDPNYTLVSQIDAVAEFIATLYETIANEANINPDFPTDTGGVIILKPNSINVTSTSQTTSCEEKVNLYLTALNFLSAALTHVENAYALYQEFVMTHNFETIEQISNELVLAWIDIYTAMSYYYQARNYSCEG